MPHYRLSHTLRSKDVLDLSDRVTLQFNYNPEKLNSLDNNQALSGCLIQTSSDIHINVDMGSMYGKGNFNIKTGEFGSTDYSTSVIFNTWQLFLTEDGKRRLLLDFSTEDGFNFYDTLDTPPVKQT